MSNTNTGGPAFPGLHPSQECRFNDPGMTLRDYFAAHAMQGLLASGWCAEERELSPRYGELDVAADAYRMAAAMLKARDAAS